MSYYSDTNQKACSVLLSKKKQYWEMSKILVTLPYMTFYENAFSTSWVVRCGQTDMEKLIVWLVWFGLVYLFIHSVTYVTLDTSITDYNLYVMKMIYYSHVHSVISYGIIFWGNSHLSDSIFKIQKRIIRVITNSGRHDSCRDFYKKLQILPLPSQYIFSLLVFVNKNRS